MSAAIEPRSFCRSIGLSIRSPACHQSHHFFGLLLNILTSKQVENTNSRKDADKTNLTSIHPNHKKSNTHTVNLTMSRAANEEIKFKAMVWCFSESSICGLFWPVWLACRPAGRRLVGDLCGQSKTEKEKNSLSGGDRCGAWWDADVWLGVW